MENNDTAKTIELPKEFWDWLWEKDGKTFALITLGHRELIETKWEEYEREKASKESEERHD